MLNNSRPISSGLRHCYWHSDYVSECQLFSCEQEHTGNQLNNPEFNVMNSEIIVIESEIEARAAVMPLLGVLGGEAESPHTITSGLLSHGETNHD